MKFAFIAAIAIIPAIGSHFVSEYRIGIVEEELTKAKTEHKAEISALESNIEDLEDHNKRQDIETATWRATTDVRLLNIENLTDEIHKVIVK